jgi:hypothetical protein
MIKEIRSLGRSHKLRFVGLVGVIGLCLTGCTGRGGGWLPPGVSLGATAGDGSITFNDQATLGFSFSCQDSSQSTQLNSNQTGQLHIELDYTEHSTSGLLGGPFSIHGVADTIDPSLESAVCIGQNAPPLPGTLTFFGVYWPTSSSAGQFPTACRPMATDSTTPLCRFQVDVIDNDGNHAPSQGDYFSSTLSGTATTTVSPYLASPLIYHRQGTLGGGNITVN